MSESLCIPGQGLLIREQVSELQLEGPWPEGGAQRRGFRQFPGPDQLLKCITERPVGPRGHRVPDGPEGAPLPGQPQRLPSSESQPREQSLGREGRWAQGNAPAAASDMLRAGFLGATPSKPL